MAPDYRIAALWIGGPLGYLEALCLSSFVAAGHETVLYAYGPVGNLPAGVSVADAEAILPEAGMRLHGRTGSPALHSDLFRYRLLAATDRTIWADTDAYCLHPFRPREGHFHAWESETGVNGGVLALPQDSATLAALLAFTAEDHPVPPWFPEPERRRLAALTDAGTPVHVAEMAWGVWGPRALTHFLRETGEIRHALPRAALYPVAYADRRLMLRPGADLAGHITPETVSIHFYGRRMRARLRREPGGVPRAGSLIARLLARHGIDPAPRDEPLGPAASVAALGEGGLAAALAHQAAHGSALWLAGPAAGAGTAAVADARAVRDPADLPPVEAMTAAGSFGDTVPIAGIAPYLARLAPGGRLLIAIRRGSGAVRWLARHGTVARLPPAAGQPPGIARLLLTVPPRDAPARSGPSHAWAEAARALAGPDGFFREGAEHSFLFVPRGDTLVVTFDNLDIAMEKRADRRPWGFSFIEREGYSMLGVMADGWTWYRDPWVTAEFDRLAAEGFFARFARVVFYGASMGGYAAAAFSGAAPGADVVAISPQSTLDRRLVPWETRYRTAWGRDFTGPDGDAAAASRAAARVVLLYDPHEPLDAAHVARFDAPNVVRLRAPLLGHRLGSSLHQMGILAPVILGALDGSLTGPAFYRLLRARTTFPRYQRELFKRALARGRPGLARRLGTHVLAQGEHRWIAKAMRGLS